MTPTPTPTPTPTMSSPQPPHTAHPITHPTSYGARLLPSLIDHHATHTPDKPWASVPVDEQDLSKGYRDIGYGQLAGAIDRASWWLEGTLGRSGGRWKDGGGSLEGERERNGHEDRRRDRTDGKKDEDDGGQFETFAYCGGGLKDLREAVLAVAAVKVGWKILLPSAFATAEAQLHVLDVTECTAYLHPASIPPATIETLLRDRPGIRRVVVPEMGEWFSGEGAGRRYGYGKSWEEGKGDPWIVFHTSGTTGLPKPITYTNLMMTSLDAARIMPDHVDGETILDHFANKRWYTPLPALHFVGMTVTLQMTVFLSTTVVLGPSSLPASASVVSQILRYGSPAGVILPPSLLGDLCATPSSLAQVRQLQYVYFAGAPLAPAVGHLIAPHVKLMPAIGSTEAGAYFVHVRPDDDPATDDWKYYSFRPAMGVAFTPHTRDGLCELVFRRQPEYARWQQVFCVYPALTEFPTKDLWAPHPHRNGLWEYRGRTDDLVVFSHGKGLNAVALEAVVEQDPRVKGALIGGEGRKKPFLILELADDHSIEEHENSNDPDLAATTAESAEPAAKASAALLLATVRPSIERANALCSPYVRLSEALTLIASPKKPFARTAKGTVARRDTLERYAREVEALYEALEAEGGEKAEWV